jgi:1,4-alpha-glucan branching enzyme
MGGNLLPSGNGATFKVWAPAARNVDVLYQYGRDASGTWKHRQSGSLTKMPGGIWAGFVPGLIHGDRYMFHVRS